MYFFKYLKFLITATNQHGVHSPFVYAFVTKCLYNKQKYSSQKVLNVVLKILAYFNISQINFKQKNNLLEQEISINFPEIRFNENSYDLIYFDHLNEEVKKFIENSAKLQNNSMIFINGIFSNKDAWKLLQKLEKVTVSIDLFYCGVLFFRREQAKEYFKIRI